MGSVSANDVKLPPYDCKQCALGDVSNGKPPSTALSAAPNDRPDVCFLDAGWRGLGKGTRY